MKDEFLTIVYCLNYLLFELFTAYSVFLTIVSPLSVEYRLFPVLCIVILA